MKWFDLDDCYFFDLDCGGSYRKLVVDTKEEAEEVIKNIMKEWKENFLPFDEVVPKGTK